VTCKERVKKAIAHEQTDIVPYQIGFTIPVYKSMQEYYKDPGFEAGIGNHLAGVEAALKWTEAKPDFLQDAFGVIWDKSVDKDIGVVSNAVIASKKDLDSYRFPDTRGKDLYAHIPAAINSCKDFFILGNIGFSLFERAWTMRGMENLLMDMVTDEGFVDALLDRILEFNLSLVEEQVKFPLDGFMFGDDWGQQHGLITGPKLWRRFIKPMIAKMYARVHRAGLPVWIHSCGDVDELFPDLIEAGLDVFNPFQPEVMDVYEMKKKFGGKLSFYGGLSTQKILPYGTPDDVRRETKKLMKEIGRDGGYILAPAHSIPRGTPPENIAALIETVNKQ